MLKTLTEKVFSFCNKLARGMRAVFAFVKRDKFLAALVIVLFFSILIFIPQTAWAQSGESPISDTLYNLITVDSVAGFLARLLFLVAYVLGWMVAQIFSVVVAVAGFNDFITMPAVQRGWVIVRDVVNLFFVFILLIIAISEILHLGKYTAKQLVPKVLLAAVMVNFSKMICGLIIDFSQVVMLTFVNGFKETAGGNIVVGLGLDKMMDSSLAKTETGETKGYDLIADTLMTVALACFLLLLVLIVVFFMAALLTLRIAILMFLVVLSPFAFVFNIVPISKKFSGKASEWWDKFINYTVMGPMMAFFLWLSLLMMSQGSGMLPADSSLGADFGDKLGLGGPSMGLIDNMMMFALGLSMLVASLMAAVETGGYAAQLGQMGLKQVRGLAGKLASPVTARAGAVWAGYSAQRKNAQNLRMAKWGRYGGRAFAGVEKLKELPRTAVTGAAGVVTGGGAMTLSQLAGGAIEAGVAARVQGASVGGALRAAVAGGAGRVFSAEGLKQISDATKRSAAGWRRFSGFDNAGQVQANKATGEANRAARAEASENLKALKIFDDKDKRRDVINSVSASSQEKQVALLEHAKKGLLENQISSGRPVHLVRTKMV